MSDMSGMRIFTEDELFNDGEQRYRVQIKLHADCDYYQDTHIYDRERWHNADYRGYSGPVVQKDPATFVAKLLLIPGAQSMKWAANQYATTYVVQVPVKHPNFRDQEWKRLAGYSIDRKTNKVRTAWVLSHDIMKIPEDIVEKVRNAFN